MSTYENESAKIDGKAQGIQRLTQKASKLRADDLT